jgi:NAD(P)-dependent dehydrogenase (short-subunit alcohol dehydrogenase family)
VLDTPAGYRYLQNHEITVHAGHAVLRLMGEREEAGRALSGRVAIVTGAGSSGPGWGTGKAMSVLFARHGAEVVLVDMFEERAAQTLSLVEAEGGSATVMTADLTEPSSYQQIVDAAVDRFGRIDVLVNNAAVGVAGDIFATSPEEYHRSMAVNLTAPYMLTRAALPVIVDGGGGSVLFISSIAATRGLGGGGLGTAYATAKAGLIGLTTNLADGFGTRGVRVNCIVPGILDTPMRAAGALEAGYDPALLDMSDRTSLGFEGDAWDIARAALFLVGPSGRYVTGVVLPIDGGSSARSH